MLKKTSFPGRKLGMCPISVEMLERMIPPTELVLLRTLKKTQNGSLMSIYGCLHYLQTECIALWFAIHIVCSFSWSCLFVCFFGQVIKWEYNSVSINNIFIKFINLEHYLLLHTCQLFLNNQSNLFQMWKITNYFAHLNIAFFLF